MGFLDQWGNGGFGEVRGKERPAYQPPSLEIYRERLANAAEGAAVKLGAGEAPETMGWYAMKADEIEITLRMGVVPLALKDGRMRTRFKTVDRAVEFLTVAAAAARAGELDELITRARLKKSQRQAG